jgi:hypothetical protein
MEVFEDAPVIGAFDSRAGREDDAIVNRMDGAGCRVGKMARGLPNVGSDSEIGAAVGWSKVGNEAEVGSFMCFDTR